MSYTGKNIKKIRSVKKLSQSQFGELFGLNRGAVGAYEEERAEPKIETIIHIAKHFGLSVDILLLKELTVNDLYKFKILNKKLDKAHHFDSEPSQTPKKGSISMVPAEKSLEYLVNYGNRDFIATLPGVDLPVSSKEESRAFELEGSEMEYNQNGLHHGDIVLGQAVNLKSQVPKVGQVYTIVTSDYIKTRRLKAATKEQFQFSSDDPNYALITLDKKEINQLWQVIGAYSTYLNPPKMIEERVLLIENQLKEIQKKLGTKME